MRWWARLTRRFVRRRPLPAPLVAQPAYPVSSRWAEPALPPPAAPPGPGVRLGFADGSEVELDAAHPSVRALRAVADLLVQDDGKRAENTTESTMPVAEGS